jgi:hypothetical protein
MPEWKTTAFDISVCCMSSRTTCLWSLSCVCLYKFFFPRLCACPWSCGFDTETSVVCDRQSIIAPGSTHMPALLLSLHSWEVSAFPGRWSTNICSSLSNFRRPWVLFCCSVSKGGWGAWEFPAVAITSPHQNGSHVTLLCHSFLVFFFVFFFLVELEFELKASCLQNRYSVLPLELHLQSILLWLFWRWDLANNLPGLA